MGMTLKEWWKAVVGNWRFDVTTTYAGKTLRVVNLTTTRRLEQYVPVSPFIIDDIKYASSVAIARQTGIELDVDSYNGALYEKAHYALSNNKKGNTSDLRLQSMMMAIVAVEYYTDYGNTDHEAMDCLREIHRLSVLDANAIKV